MPGWGLASPGAAGELLVDLLPPNPLLVKNGGVWTGTPLGIPLKIPQSAGLIGKSFYSQGLFIDFFAGKFGLTGGVELLVGP